MERVGIIQIAKADLVDDPYSNIQLQTELKSIVQSATLRDFV